jgi:osmotically-inducible protein OsmY
MTLEGETEMASLKLLCALAIALFLVGASGCAEFRECGPEGCPNDQKITANVQARLNQQPDLGPPGSITVQTVNRVVYLNGLVDVGLEKRNAESVAKQVPGVSQVVNNIAVEH